jgi:hypothetical protein
VSTLLAFKKACIDNSIKETRKRVLNFDFIGLESLESVKV